VNALDTVAQKMQPLKLLLAIGKRGFFRGDFWEVIGFMRRHDGYAPWDEYLIFNPWQGFQFLVHYHGHWSCVSLLPGHATAYRWQGQEFKKYAHSEVKTLDVVGEFYWRVQRGEKVVVTDYIAPPHVLSLEYNAEQREQSWSGGEYVESAEIQAAFGEPKMPLPRPHGVCLNEPNRPQQTWREVMLIFLMLLMGLLCLHFLFEMRYAAKTNGVVTVPFLPGQNEQLITPPFQLTHSGPLKILGSATLPANSYLGLKGRLVEEGTQRSYELAFPLSNVGGSALNTDIHEASLPGVAAGRYYLSLQPDAAALVQAQQLKFSYEHGGLYRSNLVLSLVLLCGWPLWTLLRVKMFEGRRWSESDFSPDDSSAGGDSSGFLDVFDSGLDSD
jgi:Domain of unknown function (DUF4178)